MFTLVYDARKLGLLPKEAAPGINMASRRSSKPFKPKRKNDIMTKQEKELVEDFARRISTARQSKGWNQSELAKRMAETVNVVKLLNQANLQQIQ